MIRRSLRAAALLLAAPAALAQGTVPRPGPGPCPPGRFPAALVYSMWHTPGHPPYSDLADHPLVTAALLPTRWSALEPERGVFDWSALDEAIAEWTGSRDPGADTARKAVIGLIPWSTWWPDRAHRNANGDTPRWVARAGVPVISFEGGAEARGLRVHLPRAWDRRFYPLWEEYLAALGRRYGGDRRVGGIQVGIGFLGTTEMYYGAEGNAALREAGWTVRAWEEHCRRMIDLAVKHLGAKPLFVRFTERFRNRVFTKDQLPAARAILEHAVSRGVSVSLGDPDPDWKPEWYGAPLARHLGTLQKPPGFFLGIEDDCAFWAENDPRCNHPGTGRKRDAAEMRRMLDLALAAARSAGPEVPVVLYFQRPELAASLPGGAEFRPEVEREVLRAVCR